jgi:mannose-6-phosphate isomerase class I
MKKLLCAIPLFVGLLFTSCYGDDISEIKKRLDTIEGARIASIQEQIDAINKSLPELKKAENDVLASCEYFTVKKAMVKGEKAVKIDESSFVSLIVVDGTGTIALGDDKLEVAKGDSVFVPAQNGEIVLGGEMEVIVSSL